MRTALFSAESRYRPRVPRRLDTPPELLIDGHVPALSAVAPASPRAAAGTGACRRSSDPPLAPYLGALKPLIGQHPTLPARMRSGHLRTVDRCTARTGGHDLTIDS